MHLCEINIKCDVSRSHRNCDVQGPLSFFKDDISGNKLDMIHKNNNKQGVHWYTDGSCYFTDQNNSVKQILKQPHGVPTGRQRLSHMAGITLQTFHSKTRNPPSEKQWHSLLQNNQIIYSIFFFSLK